MYRKIIEYSSCGYNTTPEATQELIRGKSIQLANIHLVPGSIVVRAFLL